jgi:hypothetical protein
MAFGFKAQQSTKLMLGQQLGNHSTIGNITLQDTARGKLIQK